MLWEIVNCDIYYYLILSLNERIRILYLMRKLYIQGAEINLNKLSQLDLD